MWGTDSRRAEAVAELLHNGRDSRWRLRRCGSNSRVPRHRRSVLTHLHILHAAAEPTEQEQYMPLRTFLGLVGAVGLIAGALALLLPINLHDEATSSEVRCSQPFSIELSHARLLDKESAESWRNRTPTDHVGECKSAATFRKAWGTPALIIGGILLAGAVLVRPAGTPKTAEPPAANNS
ncbi:hypothetical protein MMAG44476_39180 [Mycolicibacterium mageritense DSM 44476 = CIP 104973]|nr:hypothetical protein AWB94_08845 [Mycolicibacterium canariasense]